jgi:large subunit ribosomal protein L10
MGCGPPDEAKRSTASTRRAAQSSGNPTEGAQVEATLREPRAEKVAVVEEIEARFGSAAAALLTEYRGLPVKEVELLRRALRTAGGDYKIYKNTLVRRAIASGGYQAIEPLLTGPTAIAFVEGDVVAVAKVLRDFARTNPNLIVKGGIVGGDVLDAGRAAALAELPSREALLAQIAGVIAAPLQQFAGLLQALPLKFAYALKALIEASPEAESAPVEVTPVVEAAVTSEEVVGAAEPEAAASDSAEPEAAEPEAAEPEAAEPAAAASDSAEPEAAEPEATEPEGAAPELESDPPAEDAAVDGAVAESAAGDAGEQA